MNIEAQQVSVGNDVIGRDKVIQATTYIEHATIIQAGSAVQATSGESVNQLFAQCGVEFVRIPAGPFLMGSVEGNLLASESEKPQHCVEIIYDYWIGRYPITNGQFAQFVQASGRPIKFAADWGSKADHPAVNVTWREALEYCNWLQGVSGRDLPGAAGRIRLPTEAEWEKAARGMLAAHEWPWGDEFDQARCNSEESGKKTTTPIGFYSPQGDSAYGVADMVGNVWEWTASLWGQDLFRPQYRYPYQPRDGREKLDASNALYRVVRGGAFNSRQSSARVAYRYWFDPRARSESVGFRIVIAPRLS